MIVYILAGVIAFLLVERMMTVNRLETQREIDIQRINEYWSQALDRMSATHDKTCDRLMARSLGEAKSWQSSEQAAKPEPVDMSWMQPDFSMPEEGAVE